MTGAGDPAEGVRGRLLVVTGGPLDVRAAVAAGLGRRSERAVVVDATVFDAMLVSERADPAAPAGLEALRLRMLRWSAAIATAETYLLEGYDAIVTDDLAGDRLEDFLDLAAPETVHVVVLDDGHLDPTTPPWGLRVGCPEASPAAVAETVDTVVGRLGESRVQTAATP